VRLRKRSCTPGSADCKKYPELPSQLLTEKTPTRYVSTCFIQSISFQGRNSMHTLRRTIDSEHIPVLSTPAARSDSPLVGVSTSRRASTIAGIASNRQKKRNGNTRMAFVFISQRSRWIRGAFGLCACIALLSSCASIQGYPADPEATNKTLVKLAPYFDGTEEAQYAALSDADARTKKRNEIVFARMRGYDIEFSSYERQLYGFSNSVSVGTDLIGLTLGGLTATVGSAATKAALGAASAGVLGANTAINKDLYFQKTIPALIAQMEANRAKKLLVIFQGLAQPDAKYSLMIAYSDLDSYKNAGGIPDAIGSITQDASNAKQTANDNIAFTRTSLDVVQLPDKEAIQAQLKKLTDPQVLALAKAMQTNLASRPPGIQQLVKTIDADDTRLSGNVAAAKNVINAWAGEEDMTAANKKQWADAITSVTK
jgi:hypothetical protein